MLSPLKARLKYVPNMPLAPNPSAQDATKNVAKGITTPIYATQACLPPLAEFIPDIEKKREQFQERGKAAAVSCPTPTKKLLAVIYASFQLPMEDTMATQIFGLLASAGVPLVQKKSVVMASSRVVLETIQ